jgi:ABC-type glycerol-3-phosphate transport system substrate-binding protein
MAATRRSVLRGMALSGLAIGSGSLLAACGDDGGGGGGSGEGATVKFGINEAEGAGPAHDRLAAMADAYAKESGTEVALNAVDHNTFQESISTYLQGTPDDVFTWFAGFRMAQFAEAGLISDVSDIWPIDGLADSFKEASTAPDGKQYFVPVQYYPWAVFYRKSVFEKNGWAPPATNDDFMALMDDRTGGRRWAPSTSSTCASTASTST